ncbi:ABC transporter ATP-binding protein [Microbacterium sp. BK668]|uniref:ABC transporter ATP-binding protein n=1 Tax=Microbacterium sp. BK668 TaxID=2512118 RepID=UPI00105D1CE1|nr:ABC transporter ATP-binding protein [Microbacterium sp. BK668]TDN92234.1 putative ABC transport system ATP-binding protein [Microbacterium sp. BK668]
MTSSVPLVLRAEEVTRVYGRGDAAFHALRGVTLDVRRGESLAIVGKSGSGKSTLMHLLALLDRPTTGRIEIEGRDAARLRERELNLLRNATFGFVFQQFFLTAGQTVLDNVSLPLVIAGVAPRERRRRTMEALDALGLADKARNRAGDLSGGQKQRVVIARALVNEPQVIFADEPTGNLDSATGAQVEDILFRLQRERGITLVVVTHDAQLAARCDRAVTIADGLIAVGSASEAATAGRIR